MRHSTMMVPCIKQHLSNNWSSIHDKAKQHQGWVEKKRFFWKKRKRSVFQCTCTYLDIPIAGEFEEK